MNKRAMSLVPLYVFLFLMAVMVPLALYVNHQNYVVKSGLNYQAMGNNLMAKRLVNLSIYNVTYNISTNPDQTKIYIKNTGMEKIKPSDIKVWLGDYVPNNTGILTKTIDPPDYANPGMLDTGERGRIVVTQDITVNKTYQIAVSAYGVDDKIYFESREDIIRLKNATDNGNEGTTEDRTNANSSNNVRAQIRLNSGQNRYFEANWTVNMTRQEEFADIENMTNYYTQIYSTNILVEHYETSALINVRELQYFTNAVWNVVGNFGYLGPAAANENRVTVSTTAWLNQARLRETQNAQFRIRIGTTSAANVNMYIDCIVLQIYYSVFWRPRGPQYQR